MIPPPLTLELPPPGEDLDRLLADLPDTPAVFLLHVREGSPYMARTALLGRRVRRLLRSPAALSSFLNLRHLAVRVEYWPVASRLAAALTHYHLARTWFPETYLRLLKLRFPSYVKLLVQNEFPRTQVTARLSRSGLSYGPFRSRAAAEAFEASLLEHFQIRRCHEELAPAPEHPGCIYGEMNLCLRPCQQVVTPEGYATEVHRLVQFLSSEGRSLLDLVERSRDRLSADMEFEEASRQHRRLENIRATLKLRDDLATTLESACGVAVVPASAAGTVELYPLSTGVWQSPVLFSIAQESAAGKPVSLDRRLREALSAPAHLAVPAADRQEHLALLARWYYSSWRDGEWLPYEATGAIPYRRLVNMVHRVAMGPNFTAGSHPT